jgi:uncharacterized protein
MEAAGPGDTLLRPATVAERIEVIDVLRGLALFGILAANMRGFSVPPAAYLETVSLWVAPRDRAVQFLLDVFIQGKFITIFAFLFGVGFAAQLERAEMRGARFATLYSRRLGWLCLFGLVHGIFVWYGDILLVYGLAAFALLLFRRRADSTLLSWALILYLLPMLLLGMAAGIAALSGEPLPSESPVTAEELRRVSAIYSEGSWMEILRQRARDAFEWNWMYFPIIFMQTFGLFLLGALAWRRRFFAPGALSLRGWALGIAFALAIGIGGNLAGTSIKYRLDLSAYDLSGPGMAATILAMAAVPFLSFAYVGVVVLACRSDRLRARLRPFAAVGRTALTNYLLQSVIGTAIFYSYGLRLFGRFGAAWLLALTVVIFAAQVAGSSWWLGRFRFGPAEWLWRTLAYGGLQPMRRGGDD